MGHHKKKSLKSHVCIQCTDACSICLDVVNNNSCKLQCGHIFHTKCINTWFTQQWKDSQDALEQNSHHVMTRNDSRIVSFCAVINKTIMCYLDECGKFSCPVCKQEFTTKADINPNNPKCNASTMKTILCKIDMGELFGVKCTHYITDYDELYYYAPIGSLEFHRNRINILKHETKKLLWLLMASMY